jgi:pimeloyl-ACP methyl ester carboxylesterase
VDNAPVSVPLSSDFAKYVRGMKQIEEAKLTKQKEADDILQQYEPSLPIRQFLLTNLVRVDGVLKFRIPLHILGASLDNMADFPYRLEDDVSFHGPALFIKGTRSGYIREKSMPFVNKFFPASKVESVDAGHWLISEQPEAFKNGNFSCLFFRTALCSC